MSDSFNTKRNLKNSKKYIMSRLKKGLKPKKQVKVISLTKLSKALIEEY